MINDHYMDLKTSSRGQIEGSTVKLVEKLRLLFLQHDSQ